MFRKQERETSFLVEGSKKTYYRRVDRLMIQGARENLNNYTPPVRNSAKPSPSQVLNSAPKLYDNELKSNQVLVLPHRGRGRRRPGAPP